MRAVQYRILTRILNKIEVPEYIYAFERGKSIPSMAEKHVQKGLIISLDLKDFFPSIKQQRLHQVFQHIGFDNMPAKTLSELCTYKAFVPQGALTSPKLSNIIAALTFGPDVKKFADENNLTLTIYADDITLSSKDDLYRTVGAPAVGEIVEAVSQIVERHGFKMNRRKTKKMRPFQRQYVCGVVVNYKVNLQKTERNKLRAIVHNCVKNGIVNEAGKTGTDPLLFKQRTMGRLNWFSQLNPLTGATLKANFDNIQDHVDTPRCTPMATEGRVEATVPLDLEKNSSDTLSTVIVS